MRKSLIILTITVFAALTACAAAPDVQQKEAKPPQVQPAEKPPAPVAKPEVEEMLKVTKQEVPPVQPATPPATTVAKAPVKKKKTKVFLSKLAPRTSKLLWSHDKGDFAAKFDLWEPTDVAVDVRKNIVFVPSNNTYEIYILDATTGDLKGSFGEKGESPGQFLDLVGLDVDREGNLYVTDKAKSSIIIFNSKGTFLREVKLPDITDPKIVAPPVFQDVAVDKQNGDLYVVDTKNHVIWVVSRQGKFLRLIGEPGFQPGQLRGPVYISIDKNENIVVSSIISSQLVTYTKSGKFVHTFGSKAPRIGSFTFLGGHSYDAEGNLLAVDTASATIQAFLRDGRYLYHVGNETGEQGVPIYAPKTIMADSKNRIFVVEGLVDRVQAFQLTGDAPPPQHPEP